MVFPYLGLYRPNVRPMLNYITYRWHRLPVLRHSCLHAPHFRVLDSVLSGQTVRQSPEHIRRKGSRGRLPNETADIRGVLQFSLHVHPVPRIFLQRECFRMTDGLIAQGSISHSRID